MTETDKQTSKDLTPIRFQFFSLKFKPYNELEKTNNTKSIIKDVMNYLTQEINSGKGHLINKHQNRTQEAPRELFLTKAIYMHKESRIRCSLALLRSGRMPMLKPADKFMLIPLDKSQGEIAEQSHFYIDYSKGYGIICAEYNYHGPRISDFEYYLRNVAHDKLKLAKATEVEMFMDTTLDKTLEDLKNVLNIDIKIQPQKLNKLDTAIVGQYFTSLTNLGNKIKPKFLKLEAMFQTQGKIIESKEINKEANTMVTNFLNMFKSKPANIDCFENFVVKYEGADGKEEVFNLLKGKKEIIKEVDISKPRNERQWYELIEPEFNEFVQTI
jgi:hypothetical protein